MKKNKLSLLALCAVALTLVTGCAGLEDKRSVSRDSFPYYSQAPKVLQYYWCQNPSAAMHEPHDWRGDAMIWGGPQNWRVENVGTR